MPEEMFLVIEEVQWKSAQKFCDLRVEGRMRDVESQMLFH